MIHIRVDLGSIEWHESREVATRVAERDRTLETKARLPDERQVHAFEVREANVLAAEALHVLDTIDDYRPSEYVTQREYVRLFERGARLVGQRDYVAPVLFELTVVDFVVERACHQDLVLFPARLEKARKLLECVGHDTT